VWCGPKRPLIRAKAMTQGIAACLDERFSRCEADLAKFRVGWETDAYFFDLTTLITRSQGVSESVHCHASAIPITR